MIWLAGFGLLIAADFGIAWVMGRLDRLPTPTPPYRGPEGGRRTYPPHPSIAGTIETEEAA